MVRHIYHVSAQYKEFTWDGIVDRRRKVLGWNELSSVKNGIAALDFPNANPHEISIISITYLGKKKVKRCHTLNKN